jgi:hypothetical protein
MWDERLATGPEAEDIAVSAAAESYRVTLPLPDILGYARAFGLESPDGNNAFNAWKCMFDNEAAGPKRKRKM